MTKRVQLIRHDNAGASTFLGKLGETTVNTSNKSLHVHDGVNAGGTEQARADLDNVVVATAGVAGKMSAVQAANLVQALADIITNASNISSNDTDIATNVSDIADRASLLIPATTNNVAILDAAGDLADGLATVAELLARANHTGTQLLSTISDSGALAALDTVDTAEVDNNAITLAKLATMATNSFMGRDTAGTGNVEIISATQVRTIINVENGADVTDTANVTSAGALMDSEVDADIKTLSLPASVTISTFIKTLLDDANAATALATLLGAPLANPALTGNPTAPTQTAGNDSTRLATTAYVQTHTAGLQTKVIDIGDWDMDANASATIAHGLTFSKIRNVSAMIRSDADNAYFTVSPYAYSSGALQLDLTISTIGTSNVVLARFTGGQFDDAQYNSTSFNRGWITIQYVD